MRKRIVAAVTAGALLLSLAGCASHTYWDESDDDFASDDFESSEENSDYLHETSFTLSDGRTVTCIMYDGTSYAGGLSCDWESAALDTGTGTE
jgi:hypothetical protein